MRIFFFFFFFFFLWYLTNLFQYFKCTGTQRPEVILMKVPLIDLCLTDIKELITYVTRRQYPSLYNTQINDGNAHDCSLYKMAQCVPWNIPRVYFCCIFQWLWYHFIVNSYEQFISIVFGFRQKLRYIHPSHPEVMFKSYEMHVLIYGSHVL